MENAIKHARHCAWNKQAGQSILMQNKEGTLKKKKNVKREHKRKTQSRMASSHVQKMKFGSRNVKNANANTSLPRNGRARRASTARQLQNERTIHRYEYSFLLPDAYACESNRTKVCIDAARGKHAIHCFETFRCALYRIPDHLFICDATFIRFLTSENATQLSWEKSCR